MPRSDEKSKIERQPTLIMIVDRRETTFLGQIASQQHLAMRLESVVQVDVSQAMRKNIVDSQCAMLIRMIFRR